MTSNTTYYLYDVITKKTGDERYLKKTDYVTYSLPIATSTTLGGIKIGDGLDIASDGTVSVDLVSTWAELQGKPFTSVSSGDFTTVDGLLAVNTSKYYDKTEVNNLIANLKKATITIVDSLPSTGEEGIIYFVGSSAPYEQYVWENSGWIDIGSTEVDLTPYVKYETALMANKIVLGGTTSKSVKSSVFGVTTSVSNNSSNIPTSAGVYSYGESIRSELETAVNTKQDKFKIGSGIAFNNNILSVKTGTYVLGLDYFTKEKSYGNSLEDTNDILLKLPDIDTGNVYDNSEALEALQVAWQSAITSFSVPQLITISHIQSYDGEIIADHAVFHVHTIDDKVYMFKTFVFNTNNKYSSTYSSTATIEYSLKLNISIEPPTLECVCKIYE